MKFAAQFMQFMVLIPAAILCFLPMKDQLTSPPKKIIARIWLVLTILIPVSALIFMAGNFPANYVMLPDIAILYLFYHRSLNTHWATSLGIFNGNRTDVLSSKYRALHRLPDSPAGDTALPLSCSDLCTICHQRRICPALLSHL